MKNFTIRLRFTHTPGSYETPMGVYLNNELGILVGCCTVFKRNDEVVGDFSLNVAVDDTMYVYYRRNAQTGFIDAIQLRDEPIKGQEALTIAELLR